MKEKIDLTLKQACRICMKEDTKLLKIFADKIFFNITQCFDSIPIAKDDGLPEKICELCHSELNIAVAFRNKAVESTNKWRAMIDEDVLDTKTFAETVTSTMEQNLYIKEEPMDASNFVSADSFKDEINSDNFIAEDNSSTGDDDDETESEAKVTNSVGVGVFESDPARYVMYQPQRVCPNCGLTFKSKEDLKSHRTIHQCYTELTCTICDVMTTTKRALKRHYKCTMHLSKLGLPPIDQTKKKRKVPKITKESLAIECKLEYEPFVEYKCPTCFKSFKSKAGVRRHLPVHNPHKYTCGLCHKEFSRSDQLSSHLKTHEPDAPRYECDLCGKSYLKKNILSEHMRIHTKDSYAICPFCGRNFTCVSNMKQHMLRHTNTKNFSCKYCGKAFISKGEMKGHERVHTGVQPYVCDTCGKAFSMSYSLKKHKRIHTGERPYPCEYCPKRFRVLEKLKVHTRIHTGEKPYACRFCGRCFTQKNDMVKHERIHSGTQQRKGQQSQTTAANRVVDLGTVSSADGSQMSVPAADAEYKEPVLMMLHQQQQ